MSSESILLIILKIHCGVRPPNTTVAIKKAPLESTKIFFIILDEFNFLS